MLFHTDFQIFTFVHYNQEVFFFGLNVFHIWHVVFLLWWGGYDLQQVMLYPLQNNCNPRLY